MKKQNKEGIYARLMTELDLDAFDKKNKTPTFAVFKTYIKP